MGDSKETTDRLIALVDELRQLSAETEWVEFKRDNADPDRIARTISSLANAARLANQPVAYVLWGIDNSSHNVVGTAFDPVSAKHSAQPLKLWLSQVLRPDLNFDFTVVPHPSGRVVVLHIPAASLVPVKYNNIAYIRIAEATVKVGDHPQREAALLASLRPIAWESGVALGYVTESAVLELLDSAAYFVLTTQRPSSDPKAVLEYFAQDKLIARDVGGRWNILNLGAILFAKHLDSFGPLARKATRVVQYKGVSRTATIREQKGGRGYAAGFSGLLQYLETTLPSSERVEKGIKERQSAYPDIAVRELVANALIHQDMTITGAGPMIEIFSDRIEITNPGKPLIEPNRFMDLPPRSRNEGLASLMRRMGVCEERGSGIDKVVSEVEMAQLPPPSFLAPEDNTQAILYGPRSFKDMSSELRIRACYWHAVLRFVQGEGMTNATLRERFGVDDSKASQISRIINQAEEAKLIRQSDEWSPRTGFYLPIWA